MPFLLLGIFAQSETCNANWFHYKFVDEIGVGHTGYFLDDTPKKEITYVRVVILPTRPFLQWSIINHPLKKLMLI